MQAACLIETVLSAPVTLYIRAATRVPTGRRRRSLDERAPHARAIGARDHTYRTDRCDGSLAFDDPAARHLVAREWPVAGGRQLHRACRCRPSRGEPLVQ